MSTRSTITIKGNYATLKLYHHCDGYPEGVGFDLMNRFYKKFQNEIYPDFNDVCNNLVKDTNDEYEITEYNHVDREYEYEIDTEAKTIRCWKVDWEFDKKEDSCDWKAHRGEEIDLVKLWGKQEV